MTQYGPVRFGTEGLPPGTLVYTGRKKAGHPSLTLISYDLENLEERSLDPSGELTLPELPGRVHWLNLEGLQDTELLARLGETYGIHELVLEDILDTTQRSKMEVTGEYVFFVFKIIDIDPETERLRVEQVSFLLGNGLLLSFQENAGPIFESVRQRLRKGLVKIRKAGADYLAYALLDVVVDHYFSVLETIQGKIENLEDRLSREARDGDLSEIHNLRRRVSRFRQLVWPLREALSRFRILESKHLKKGTRVYLSDLYDHVIQVLDMLETSRENATGLMDLYMSVVSNRLNEVMKILTIISTLFIPVTCLAGIYGMNFRYMPELDWRWSYPIFWIVTGGLMFGMIRWFKRKHWL